MFIHLLASMKSFKVSINSEPTLDSTDSSKTRYLRLFIFFYTKHNQILKHQLTCRHVLCGCLRNWLMNLIADAMIVRLLPFFACIYSFFLQQFYKQPITSKLWCGSTPHPQSYSQLFLFRLRLESGWITITKPYMTNAQNLSTVISFVLLLEVLECQFSFCLPIFHAYLFVFISIIIKKWEKRKINLQKMQPPKLCKFPLLQPGQQKL